MAPNWKETWTFRSLWFVSLIFLGAWLVSSLFRPEPSQEARRYFDVGFLETARSRATLSYLDSGLSTLAMFGLLFVIVRFAEMSGLRCWAGFAAGLLLGISAALLFTLVSLPFDVYRFYLDKRFGLTTMTLGTYLIDYAKSFGLSALEYGVSGGFAAWALSRFPRTWFLVLGAAFVVATVFVSAIYPSVIAPMFYKFHPLPPGDLRDDVMRLASQAGMEVDNVLVMEASAKTNSLNAYFAGIGKTKQIVLYDNLITKGTREQVSLVVAHELGHWKMGHIVKGIVVSSVAAILALWTFSFIEGPGNTHGLGRTLAFLLVFTTLAGWVFTPASNYLSRRFEGEADRFSLDLTNDRSTFIAAQVTLAQSNLSDVEPPPFIRWFAWTHPTTLERIESAAGSMR